MLLCAENVIISLDDKFVFYSPFLSTMIGSGIGIEKVDDAVKIEVKPEILQTYIDFLSGKDFTLTHDAADFFDFMGHSNEMEYPIEYWAVKLHDNWIRDNFEKFELWKDPYYDLVEIDIDEDRLKKLDLLKSSHPDGMYIAGGAALYFGGIINKLKDIDLFFTSKDVCHKFLYDQNADNNIVFTDNSISYRSTDSYSIQCIRRLYRSPSEIVHGFDLDCVGVLYDGKKLWATKRAYYSIQNRVNWFDPKRVSPSYAYRLAKYKIRGFEIELPLFETHLEIDMKVIDDLKKRILNMFFTYEYPQIDNIIDIDIDFSILSNFHNIVTKNFFPDRILNIGETISLYQVLNTFIKDNELQVKCIYNIYGYLIHCIHQNSHTEDILYNDYASILLMAKYLGIIGYNSIESDYIPKEVYQSHILKLNKFGYEKICALPWKEQNPGEQLSGTFFPSPISSAEDLIEWYKKSPLIIKNNYVYKGYIQQNYRWEKIVYDRYDKTSLNPDRIVENIFKDILIRSEHYKISYWNNTVNYYLDSKEDFISKNPKYKYPDIPDPVIINTTTPHNVLQKIVNDYKKLILEKIPSISKII